MSIPEPTGPEPTGPEVAEPGSIDLDVADLVPGVLGADDAESAAAAPAAPGAVESDDAVYYEEQVQPEYGILGLTLRELIIVSAWAVAFIVSFFAVSPHGGSVWAGGIDWILTIGLPTAAVFLVVLRRFSPEGIRRVGSLGIDQFASVAVSVAAVVWGQMLWRQIAVSIDSGSLLVGWVPIVAEVAMLALVAATVAAPLIPRLRDDFQGRMETLAHRSANPVRPVIARPRPQRAVAAAAPDDVRTDAPYAEVETGLALDSDSDEGTDHDETDDETDDDVTRVVEPVPVVDGTWPVLADVTSATDAADAVIAADPADAAEPVGADDRHNDQQAPESEASLRRTRNEQSRTVEPDLRPFWILAPTEREVLDEHGHPLFRIGPTAWVLVIEDRGGAFVVRHDDGRIGYLHDITDITKG